MFTNLSNIRFNGEPYLSNPVPTLPPLRIKSRQLKHKRKPSNHSNISASLNHKPKSKVSITNSSTTAIVVKDANTKKGKKKKKPAVEGDAVVVELESEVENSIASSVDQNANSVEPFDEQVSKDIALAVAMIVAEHEMLKLKYPGKYDVDDDNKVGDEKNVVSSTKSKKKSKTVEKDKGNKQKNEAAQHQQQEKESTTTDVEGPPVSAQTVDTTPEQTEKVQSASSAPVKLPKSLQKSGIVSASSTTNDNASSVSTPPASVPHQPKTKQMPSRKESSVTFTVPSRSATTAVPATTASAGTVSTVASNHSAVSSYPIPSMGVKMGSQLEVLKYLARIQNYLNHLGYHRLGEPETRINTRLSMKMQMMTAREIIQSALPIKCLHAVVLSVYFTNCVDTVERFPIYFRSHVSTKEYKHIVLGIYVQGHFGALGISRDGGLQDKPTSYTKLSDLIFEFAKCYGQSGHVLNEVKFGNIITHDQHSLERLFNKNYVVPVVGCLHSDIERNVEKFAKQLRSKMGPACLKSFRADTTVSSRFSRSKTSLNSALGSSNERNSTSNVHRTRALSMGPLTASNRGSNINSKNDDNGRISSKTAIAARSKPAKLTKRK